MTSLSERILYRSLCTGLAQLVCYSLLIKEVSSFSDPSQNSELYLELFIHVFIFDTIVMYFAADTIPCDQFETHVVCVCVPILRQCLHQVTLFFQETPTDWTTCVVFISVNPRQNVYAEAVHWFCVDAKFSACDLLAIDWFGKLCRPYTPFLLTFSNAMYCWYFFVILTLCIVDFSVLL